MNIKILSLSHKAPPAVSLKPHFIRGVTKTREFADLDSILKHYNKYSTAKDIAKMSSEVRYTYEMLVMKVSIDGVENVIIIPPFFVYDGESIGWLQRFNKRGSRTAALVHDWLYYCNKLSKKECDEIMRLIQLRLGVPKYIANTVHFGLKVFGNSSYAAYK